MEAPPVYTSNSREENKGNTSNLIWWLIQSPKRPSQPNKVALENKQVFEKQSTSSCNRFRVNAEED